MKEVIIKVSDRDIETITKLCRRDWRETTQDERNAYDPLAMKYGIEVLILAARANCRE